MFVFLFLLRIDSFVTTIFLVTIFFHVFSYKCLVGNRIWLVLNCSVIFYIAHDFGGSLHLLILLFYKWFDGQQQTNLFCLNSVNLRNYSKESREEVIVAIAKLLVLWAIVTVEAIALGEFLSSRGFQRRACQLIQITNGCERACSSAFAWNEESHTPSQSPTSPSAWNADGGKQVWGGLW